MCEPSLQGSWRATFGEDLVGSLGARRTPFLDEKGDPLAGPPFRVSDLVRALCWPKSRSYVYVPGSHYDYPKEKHPSWADKAQGVTHDDRYWYFSNKFGVWRFPVGYDLEGDLPNKPDVRTQGIPGELWEQRYQHYGDLDHYGGRLYVALEHEDKQIPAQVVVMDTELKTLGWTAFGAQGVDGPWCAVNPVDGFLYSSPFYDGEPGSTVYVYRLPELGPMGIVASSLSLVGKIRLIDEAGSDAPILFGIQGGAFTTAGHLYLSYDKPDATGGGVMGFDVFTGRRVVHFSIDYKPQIAVPKHDPGDIILDIFSAGNLANTENVRWQEIEGLTIWDLDTPGAPSAPNVRGQVHVVMTEGGDDLYFKHYTTVDPDDASRV